MSLAEIRSFLPTLQLPACSWQLGTVTPWKTLGFCTFHHPKPKEKKTPTNKPNKPNFLYRGDNLPSCPLRLILRNSEVLLTHQWGKQTNVCWAHTHTQNGKKKRVFFHTRPVLGHPNTKENTKGVRPKPWDFRCRHQGLVSLGGISCPIGSMGRTPIHEWLIFMVS